MTGMVLPEMLAATAREAVVKTVDRVIDAASNTFRVRLELPNDDQLIPPGLRCEVDLQLPGLPDALDQLPQQKATSDSPAPRRG